MGIVYLLVAGLALLIGFLFLPTIQGAVDNIALNTSAVSGTPLVPFVGLFVVFGVAIIIVGVIWGVARNI